MQKLIANLNLGIKPESTHIDGSRATFTFMSLKRLIAYAYNEHPYEISGPDWLATDRFDIVATLPAGATKDAVPAMMQALLKDRFALAAHRATLDQQPVLAIIVGKNGAKLKPAEASKLQPVDSAQPLKARGRPSLKLPTAAPSCSRATPTAPPPTTWACAETSVSSSITTPAPCT